MADLLPSSPDTSAAEDADPRVVGVDSDDADDLIGALSSATARELLAALHDDPANPAKLADAVDTTIQNAQYHLGKLEDAGLIEVVDTVYSEKGREMNVYAPSDRPLVVVAGNEEETGDLQSALSRLLGALAAMALGSVLVQQLLAGDLLSFGSAGDGEYAGGADGGDGGGADGGDGGDDAGDGVGGDGGDVDLASNATRSEEAEAPTATATEDAGAFEATGTPTPEDDVGIAETTGTPTPEPASSPTPAPNPTQEPAATPTPQPTADAATSTPIATPTEMVEQTATEAANVAAQMGADVAPGLLFFAGGAVVLVAGFAWRYLQIRR